MERSNFMKKLTKANFPRSFGVFSPTGHVVMAFANDAATKQAQAALLQNGFSEDDVTHYNKDEVLAEFEKSESHIIDPIQIGQDVANVEQSLELANQAAGFLDVHAPEDEEAKRAVHLVKPFGLKFAEKYNRLTLEELA
jgi:ethanolamine utilization microcompartment shell protein EutL